MHSWNASNVRISFSWKTLLAGEWKIPIAKKITEGITGATNAPWKDTNLVIWITAARL